MTIYDAKNITPYLGREIVTKSGSSYLITMRGELLKTNGEEKVLGTLEMIAGVQPLYTDQIREVQTTLAMSTLIFMFGEEPQPGRHLVGVLDNGGIFSSSKIKEIK